MIKTGIGILREELYVLNFPFKGQSFYLDHVVVTVFIDEVKTDLF